MSDEGVCRTAPATPGLLMIKFEESDIFLQCSNTSLLFYIALLYYKFVLVK